MRRFGSLAAAAALLAGGVLAGILLRGAPGRALPAAAAAALLSWLLLFLRGVRLRRELRRGAADLGRFLQGQRNARLSASAPELAEPWVQVNRLLAQCQAAEIETGRARRRMRDLLSGISHDVRTPLTSIVGYIDAMRDELSGRGGLNEEYLAIVRDKAQKLSRYVESLFLLARLEAGEHPLQLERLDLAETLREALLGFYPVLEGRKIRIEAAIPEERCPVRGDRTSLMRVFGNLITNAVEHGGEGGYLRVALRLESDAYAVRVRDRGPGIPAGAEERVFSRSFTTGGRGAGLGLAIVRELVGRHGGRVAAGNDTGGGAVFTVTLPADRQ